MAGEDTSMISGILTMLEIDGSISLASKGGQTQRVKKSLKYLRRQ